MPTPTVIGTPIKDENNEAPTGLYSQRAFKEGTAADGSYDGAWLDFGMRPEMIFISNTGGVPLEIVTHHEVEGSLDTPPSRVDSKLEAGESRVYRRRSSKYIGLRGVGGTCTYQVEAW